MALQLLYIGDRDTDAGEDVRGRLADFEARGVDGIAALDRDLALLRDSIMMESKGGHGTLKHLAPVLRMSETKRYWAKPAPVLGSSRPEWVS